MTRSKTFWRRCAAIVLSCAMTGGAVAQNPTVQNSTPGRTTQVAPEARAGSALAQPTTVGHDLTPINAATAPAKQAVANSAPAQRTTYQQSQSGMNEPPPSPASRLLNQYETANRAYVGEPIAPEPVSPQPMAAASAPMNCGAGCDCGTGCNCGHGGNCRMCCNPYFYNNGWYVGADFLFMRPNFSSPGAAVERTTVIDPNTNASTITDRVIEYDIDYDSTFRLFGGYRWGDCGESLEFSFWRVEADGDFVSPPATPTLFFASFEEATADAAGEVLRTNFNMDLDVWDIEYAKRIQVAKNGAGHCGGCCPPWDWAWSIGARIADYEREHENSVTNAAGVVLSTGEVTTTFTGAGPRAGLEGRRYFGDGSLWSLYGKSHWSLLLGDYDVTSSRTAGITTSNHSQNFIRTVPVTELEVGLSRQIGCRTLLSAGYQFQAWWEIGRFDTILIGNCECLTSSNVLSFDGLFVRLEHTFGPHCRPRCGSKCQ